jgi:hypothetical protein
MMTTLLTIFLVLFFSILIIAMIRSTFYYSDFDDEVTTTTTTTTTTTYDEPAQPAVHIVGSLTREFEGTQVFVIDPVDKMKIWLNSSDDMYEDAAGKIWTLR